MSQAYGVGGFVNVMSPAILGNFGGVVPTISAGNLVPGQQVIDTSTTPRTIYTWTGTAFDLGAANPATTSAQGIVQLSTLSQLQNGNAPSGPYVSLTNDIATVIAAVVAGAVPPATTVQSGIGFLATNAQAASGVLTDNHFINPGSLTFALANGGLPIGSVVPGTGAFTTLGATGAITFTVGGTWATGGTAIQIGHDVTNDAISIGDLGARIITIGHASGAAALNLAVGSGNFSLDGVAGSTYSIGPSTTTGTITIGGTAQSTGAITLGSSTAANSVLIQNGINTGAQIVSIANGANGANSTINLLNGIATTGTQTLNVMSTTAAATAQVINLLSGANTNTTNTVNIAGTGATGNPVTVNIGTGAAAHVLNLGVTSGASGIAMLVGTGNFSLNGATGSTYTIAAATTTGAITIGGTAQSTGVITLGSSSATSTVKIASGAGASTVTIAEGTAGANTVSILNGATAATGTVNILSGSGSAGGGALHMADNGRVTAISLGNVAPAASRTTTFFGGASAQNDSFLIMGGASTANTQKMEVLNGAINGSTNLINLLSGTIAGGTQTFNLFNGNASGGTLVANIFGSVAATTAGTLNLNTGAAAHVLNVGSATAGNTTITFGAGTTNAIIGSASTINIGADAAANVITLGSTTTTSGLTLKAGSGNFVFTSVAGMTATMFAANTTGAITIGGTAQSTGAITLGNSSATNTLNLGIGNGANTTNIATGTGGNTLHIADGAGINTITIGNGAAANTVTLGSTNTTSTTTINSGSGNVNITGGSLKIASSAQMLQWKGGAATDFRGTGTLVAGTLQINNTNIATGDMIFIERTAVNASTALGVFGYTISNGASFTVNALGTLTATVLAADVSSFTYIIVRPV